MFEISSSILLLEIFSFPHSRIPLDIDPVALAYAEDYNFEIKAYSLETTRNPRTVRIGAIQNKIVLDTNLPVVEQRDAIYKKVQAMILAASICGVNVLCLQEAWSKLNLIYQSSDLDFY